MVLAALLRPFPASFKWRNGGDCVRYLTWSRVVRDQGLAAFPKLVDEYRHKWVGFPPPTRWSWLMAIAGVMKAWPKAADEYHPLVLLSWLGGVLSLLPLALWLRRRVPPEVTVIACLLCATAPVMRGMSHFPLPDSLHLTFSLLIFALTDEYLDTAPRRRWGVLIALGLATAAAITTKETGAIIVFAAVGLVVLRWRREGRLTVAPVIAMAVASVVILLVTIPLAGGASQLAGLVSEYVRGNAATGNKAYVSGPAWTGLVGFMCVSPLLLITVAAATGPTLRSPATSGRVASMLVACGVVLALFAGLDKTLRYLMPVDVGMRVIAAAAVWQLFSLGGRRRWVAVGLLAALIGCDQWVFSQLWSSDQMYDAVTWSLVKGLHMIP